MLSVVQSGGLAGESKLERLKPGETQMVTFGNELDVENGRSQRTGDTEFTGLTYGNGVVSIASKTPTERTFEVRNRSGRDRSVWIALELGPEEEVLGEVRREIDRHRGWTWVVLSANDGTAEQVVVTERVGTDHVAAEGVSAETWRTWAEADLADGTVLATAAALREKRDAVEVQIAELDREVARARTELEGLRKTLGVSDSAPVARRAGAIEAELRKRQARRSALEADVDALLQRLVVTLEPLEQASSDAG